MTITRREALKMSAPLLAIPWCMSCAPSEPELNIYSWADYIGETTIADFAKITGIKVNYDTYNSTPEMEAKMLAGSTGYDAVIHSGVTLQDFVTAGVYDRLDKRRLPNWKNLDPAVLAIASGYSQDNAYGVPYMWGSTGMTYNLDMVRQRLPGADLESLDVIFDPANAAKLADCGISLLDDQSLVWEVMSYLGKPRDVYTRAVMDDVIRTVKRIRPYVRTFDSSNFLVTLPNKEMCAVNNWSGDYSTARRRAKEAGVDINLGYFVPRTSAPAWVDMYCIVSDGLNKNSAYKFLNYIMIPEVIAKCTNHIKYANANFASRKFVDRSVLDDPTIYPTKDVLARLYAPKSLSAADSRLINDTINAIKAG
jgi:putrescine transport system substrate-binding protein